VCLYGSLWISPAVEKTTFNSPAVEKTTFKVQRVSVWPGRKVQACCTGLPARLPIKEIPGQLVLSLQPVIDTATPFVNTIWNYTIWSRYAESVISMSNFNNLQALLFRLRPKIQGASH
jgi:hypothetical protein